MTSLGIGEALVTVLSPRGVPTPLAAIRLIPPDSLMAALDPASFQQLVAAGALAPKYGQPIDRQSAHEMITAKLAAAKQAATAATPAPGTPAKAPPRGQAAEARRQQAERASKRREVETVIRAGTKIATSRTGQQLIRSVFGTLFGKGR